MKKFVKCCILAIIIAIVPLVPFSSLRTNAIEIMPNTYLSNSDFYEQINKNLDNLEIKVIGDYDFETSFTTKDEEGHISDRLDISKKVLTENNYLFKTPKKSEKGSLKALIISNEEAKNYSNFEGKEKIEEALEQGYLAIFMIDDLNTADILFSKYTGATTSTRSVNENDPIVPYACYIAKNNVGEYFTGTFYINIDAIKESTDAASLKKIKDETILYHAWCLRDINFYTKNSDTFKKQMGEKSIDLGVLTASASNVTDAFSIGSDWKSICGGWHQNIISSDNPVGFGSFWEWINFLYLKNGESGNHYYAWAIEYTVNPNVIGMHTSYVDYQSDASMFMPQGKLRTYYPKSTPVDGSYEFNFGASISSKGGPSSNIGFSRSVPKSDLRIIDNTNINYGKIRFEYPTDHFIVEYPTEYQTNASSNNAIFIYKDEGKTGHYTFHHYRSAGFSDRYTVREKHTGNWYTTYYK